VCENLTAIKQNVTERIASIEIVMNAVYHLAESSPKLSLCLLLRSVGLSKGTA
jgi:hypothetical protein